MNVHLRTTFKTYRLLLTALLAASFVVAAIDFFSSRAEWVGSWRQTENQSFLSLVFIHCVLCAVSARMASGPQRQKYAGLLDTGSRDVRAVHAQTIAAVVAVASIGYGLALLASLIITGANSPYGRSSIGFVLLVSLTSLILWATAGYVFGCRFIRLPASIFAGMVPYISYALIQYSLSEPLFSLAIGDSRDRTFYETNYFLLLLKSVCYLLVAILLFSLLANWQRFQVLLAAGSALTVGLIFFTSASSLKLDQNALNMACADGGEVQICLPNAYDHVRPKLVKDLAKSPIAELREAGIQVNLIAQYNIGQPSYAVYPQVDGADYSVTFAPGSPRDYFAHIPDRNATLNSIARGLFVSPCPVGASGQEFSSPTSEALVAWFLRSAQVPVDGSAYPGGPYIDPTSSSFSFSSRLGDMSRQERVDWFSDNFSDISSCKLTPSDFDASQ